jgi:hypothetical protein
MSTEMADFIVRLATDPVLLGQYEMNPAAVLANSGLSPSDANLLATRDPHLIRYEAGALGDRPVLSKKPKSKKKKTKKK